jgi:hypothetical protein
VFIGEGGDEGAALEAISIQPEGKRAAYVMSDSSKANP